MVVAVIGSRECGNISEKDIIKYLPYECLEIVSGGAKGIDTLAKKAAKILNVPCKEILPDYKKFSRRAPLVRNEEIVKSVDFVLAFWDLKSRGTASALNFCIKNYIPFKIISIFDGKPVEGEILIKRIIEKI